jgi:hypothetical protein
MHLESLDTNTVKPLDPVSSFNEIEFAKERFKCCADSIPAELIHAGIRTMCPNIQELN